MVKINVEKLKTIEIFIIVLISFEHGLKYFFLNSIPHYLDGLQTSKELLLNRQHQLCSLDHALLIEHRASYSQKIFLLITVANIVNS